MKFLTAIGLTALLAFAAGLYLPWWSIAIAAFVVALVLVQKPGKAFFAGFLGGLLLWGGLSLYLSLANDHILAKRVSLLILKVENPWLLIVVSGVLGALVSGLGALAAAFLRQPTPVAIAEDVTSDTNDVSIEETPPETEA